MPQPYYRLDEYFALEAAGEARYEYWNGAVLCMSGGTPQHSAISVNITSGLKARLRGSRCRVFNGDMAIKTPLAPPYRYPDASVLCGKPSYEKVDKFDTLTNPTIIIEVLSPTTLNLDKTVKRDAYQAIPSLREYLLIAQDTPQITHYIRQGDQCLRQDYGGLAITFELPTLGCQIALSEIYEDVEFD